MRPNVETLILIHSIITTELRDGSRKKEVGDIG